MEAHDHPLAHFNGMARLVEALKPLPAQLLEHQYSPEAFGSWVVVLKHKGRAAQVTFDGRDRRLSLRWSADRKPPYSYGSESTVGEGAHFGELDVAAIEAICRAITS
jgi:hypothetical protein